MKEFDRIRSVNLLFFRSFSCYNHKDRKEGRAMLSQDKLIHMTRIAGMETDEDTARFLRTLRYEQSDYVLLSVLLSWIRMSCAFLCICALLMIRFMNDLGDGIGFSELILGLIFLALIYLLLSGASVLFFSSYYRKQYRRAQLFREIYEDEIEELLLIKGETFVTQILEGENE